MQYGFKLERWILSKQHPVCPVPSCPPYWEILNSPKDSCMCDHRNRPRPRSHSLSSADARRVHHRTVKFLISDSDEEEGYCEDNEGSSAEYAPHFVNSRERPRSAASRHPLSRVKDMHFAPSTLHCKADSVDKPKAHRSTASFPDCRHPPLRALEQHRSQQASPLSERQKNGKKKQRSLGRKYSLNTTTAGFSPSTLQQRPSSAGPVVKNRRKKVLFLENTQTLKCLQVLC